MANEIRVTTSLSIIKNPASGAPGFNYSSNGVGKSVFNDDLVTAVPSGPVPGAIYVPTTGIDVDLSPLTTPGWCHLWNQDDTNYVTYGIWDPELVRFYPFGELGPGMNYSVKLARNIEEELGTGTGTAGANTNRLHIRANNAPCWVYVGAFER